MLCINFFNTDKIAFALYFSSTRKKNGKTKKTTHVKYTFYASMRTHAALCILNFRPYYNT